MQLNPNFLEIKGKIWLQTKNPVVTIKSKGAPPVLLVAFLKRVLDGWPPPGLLLIGSILITSI